MSQLSRLNESIFLLLESNDLSSDLTLRVSNVVRMTLDDLQMVLGYRALMPVYERGVLEKCFIELRSLRQACNTVVSVNGEKKYLSDMRTEAGFYEYGFNYELKEVRLELENKLLPIIRQLVEKETKVCIS